MATTTILSHQEITAKIQRLAWQICEHHHQEKQIILAGIEGNGAEMATRLGNVLKEIEGPEVEMVTVSLDKMDPLSSGVKADREETVWKDKLIILVDDVLNSGKTMAYSARFFLGFSIKGIRTVVLVDRSHHNFPVTADYVGLSLATTIQEHIRVEFGTEDKAYLM